MPTIKKSILVSASPAEVFELIANIEGIPRFSSSIVKVTRVGDNNYYWRVVINGIPLEWNSEIQRQEAPKYHSWRSISGLENRGECTLEPMNGKTKVTLMMEYHLPVRIVEKALHPIIDKFVEDVYEEILINIKNVLER